MCGGSPPSSVPAIAQPKTRPSFSSSLNTVQVAFSIVGGSSGFERLISATFAIGPCAPASTALMKSRRLMRKR